MAPVVVGTEWTVSVVPVLTTVERVSEDGGRWGQRLRSGGHGRSRGAGGVVLWWLDLYTGMSRGPPGLNREDTTVVSLSSSSPSIRPLSLWTHDLVTSVYSGERTVGRRQGAQKSKERRGVEHFGPSCGVSRGDRTHQLPPVQRETVRYTEVVDVPGLRGVFCEGP